MPIRLLLAVVAALALWWGWRVWNRLPPDKAKKTLIAAGLFALVAGGIVLLLTGRLAGLFAVLAGLSPWIGRAMRLHQLWTALRRMGGSGEARADSPPPAGPPPDSAMTRAQAYEVLGLKPGASADEIREAHRRLMRTAHPDAGGSTWIAARLNQARDLLLG